MTPASDPAVIVEIERSMAQFAPGLDPGRAARFIIALAEQQMPGAELRGLFISIAAAALLAAADLAARKPARDIGPTAKNPNFTAI